MTACKRCEAAKAAWVRLRPNATTSQYEAAMQRIAAECGV